MRIASLIGLPLLALGSLHASAATLELSFDSPLTYTYGYEAWQDQNTHTVLQVDLDNMPAFVYEENATGSIKWVNPNTLGWLRVSTQLGDKQLSSTAFADETLDAVASLLALVDNTGDTPMQDLWAGAGRFDSADESRQQAVMLSIGSEPTLPQALYALSVDAPFSFMASNLLLTWDNPEGLGDASSYFESRVETPVLINVRLLDSPTEVPLPASAWLFGSALLGLGARRRWQASHA